MEIIIFACLLAAVVGLLSFFIGRHLYPQQRDADRTTLLAAQSEIERLTAGVAGAKAELQAALEEGRAKSDVLAVLEKSSARLEERALVQDRQVVDLSNAVVQARAALEQAEGVSRAESEKVVRLLEREESFKKQITALECTCNRLNDESSKLGTQCQSVAEEVARLTERCQAQVNEIELLRSQDKKLNDTLRTEFENIATRALKVNAAELTDVSQRQIAALVDPLRERISEFQNKVETAYDAEKREVLSLKEHIRLVVEASQNLGSQADGLAKALKGDVQMLGRWGELVLERILEAAGLQEGREYITQARGLGLKSESGVVQRPDVLILLPEERTLIIDSKISLASYDRLISATAEIERAQYSGQFVRDIKAHIDGLSRKSYQDNEKIAAHDCVLMFVPIEGALAAALTAEPELFTYAWDKRVVLVGPPTLLMTLRTVASIWRYELQAQNAQEIAKLAGTLCDKVSASLADLNVVADRMNNALAAHSDAVKRLSTGKGNVLSIGERIRSLGAKTKAPMPAVNVGGELITAES
jgi:DNA recombination protein RmuC